MSDDRVNKSFRINIRLKILLGVFAVLLILLILGGTAIFNLNDIRAKFDGLVQATQVERYALKTMVEIHKEMLTLRADLTRYYTELDAAGKDDKVNQARKATDDYFKAATAWIENDATLTKEILPKMLGLATSVNQLAYDAAGMRRKA